MQGHALNISSKQRGLIEAPLMLTTAAEFMIAEQKTINHSLKILSI